ncbi:hypothetical protein Adt_04285 [Abeliophyllum distichum]|uniref:Uncharacterized protein n=1 Tax=Abeliophyllum distichum TaxID=126358 RepID=A0ABD1W180_9LAMI
MLNKLMNNMVNQVCQLNPLGMKSYFQTRNLVGNGSPTVNTSHGIETSHIGPATTNLRGPGTSNVGGSPNVRENVQIMGPNVTRINDGGNPYLNGNNGSNNGMFMPNMGPNVVRPPTVPYVHQPIGVPFDPNAILREQVMEIMQRQLDFRMWPIIQPTYRKLYPDWVDQAYPWPRGYKDAIELGQITFESKKKIAVDENPFPQPIDVDMNVLENGEEVDTKASKEEQLIEECVEKSKFESRKEDEDNDDAGQLITIQFGTMPPVMANNYLLANEFENNKHDEEMMEENEEVACTLECGEGTSATDQVIDSNDRHRKIN